MSILQRIESWQPTKAHLGWTAAGAFAATVAAGFMFGLVVTKGTAADMAQKAHLAGQTEIAANVCAANFSATTAAAEQHAELSALSNIRQRQFVQGQPWAAVPGLTNVSRDVADLCATLILQMDPEGFQLPPANDA